MKILLSLLTERISWTLEAWSKWLQKQNYRNECFLEGSRYFRVHSILKSSSRVSWVFWRLPFSWNLTLNTSQSQEILNLQSSTRTPASLEPLRRAEPRDHHFLYIPQTVGVGHKQFNILTKANLAQHTSYCQFQETRSQQTGNLVTTSSSWHPGFLTSVQISGL